MALPPASRLRKPSEFRYVLKSGRRAGDRLLLMSAKRTEGPYNRYGLSVSKRVGGAVARNRVKRRLRELLRGIGASDGRDGGKGGWDVVVSARQPAAEASFADLRSSVQSLTGRLGIAPGQAAKPGRRDDEGKT